VLRRSFVWPRVADSNCLLRADARAVEQTLIDYHGLGKDGGTLINMINFISSVKNRLSMSRVWFASPSCWKKLDMKDF